MGASWGSPAGGVDTEHQADGQDDELGQVSTSDRCSKPRPLDLAGLRVIWMT